MYKSRKNRKRKVLNYSGDSVNDRTLCTKCGKPSWTPVKTRITSDAGKYYYYFVFRHPDLRKNYRYRSCYERIKE